MCRVELPPRYWQAETPERSGDMIRAGLAITVLAMSAVGALAQVSGDLLRCRAMTDEQRRLACYDAILVPSASPLSKYEVVPLEELRSYALSYRGRLIETEGWLVPGESYLFLGEGLGDAAPIPIDANNLTRRARETLLEQCGEGCRAKVQGVVRPVNFTTGVVADSVIAP